MRASILIATMLFAGCTADREWRTKAIHNELTWATGDLLGPAAELTAWCPFFATAAVYELRTGAHGTGFYVVSPKSSPREAHVFYDCYVISRNDKAAPAAEEAEKNLRRKVSEFNALLPNRFLLSNANKYGYAYALGSLLFQGDRGRLEGIGMLDETATDPKVHFAQGKYEIRLFHSRSGTKIKYWRIEVTEEGRISNWRVDPDAL